MSSIEGGSRGQSSISGAPRMGGISAGEGSVAILQSLPGARAEHALAPPSLPMPEGGIPMTDTRSILPKIAPLKSASWDSISLDTNKKDETSDQFQTFWSIQDRKSSPFDKIMGPSKPLVVQSLPSQDRRMLNSPNSWSEIRFDKPVSPSPIRAPTEPISFVTMIQIPKAEEKTADISMEVGLAEQAADQVENAVQRGEQTEAVVERAVEEIHTEFTLARNIGEMQIDGLPQEVVDGMAQRALAQSIESKHLTPFMDDAIKPKPVVITAAEESAEQRPESGERAADDSSITLTPESTAGNPAIATQSLVDGTPQGEESIIEVKLGGAGIGIFKDTGLGKTVDQRASTNQLPKDEKQPQGDVTTDQAYKTEASSQTAQEATPFEQTKQQTKEITDTAPGESEETEQARKSGVDATKEDPQGENQWVKDEKTNKNRAKALQEAVQKAKEKKDEESEDEDVDDSTIVMNTLPINDALLSHGEDPNQIQTERIVDELEGKEHDAELQSEPLRPVLSAVDRSWVETVEEIESLDDLSPEDAETRFREIIDNKTAVTIVDFSLATRPTDEQIERVMKDHPIDLEAFRRRKAA